MNTFKERVTCSMMTAYIFIQQSNMFKLDKIIWH